jgi:membrane-bound inhibitor of C-type lysozyme
MAGKRTSRHLSIVAVTIGLTACAQQTPHNAAAGIVRPPPDDPTPTGIVYLCEGRKQVSVVYARNRASLTYDGKTWRLEYQAAESGFRYFDAQHEWVGTDSAVVLREIGQRAPLAFNCRATAKT